MGGSVERMGSPLLRFCRLSVYITFTLVLMPVQAFGLLLRQRWTSTFPVFYHRCCCRLLGLQVKCVGQPASARPILFASNHASYIDITILGSLLPASFIAKHEVATWPLFGQLAKLQRSVFIDRQRRSTAAQRDSIAGRLAAKDALVLFPEGTSGDGNRILPFKSALFSVADGQPVIVQPVSIAYTKLNGMPLGRGLRPFFAWYGDMSLAPHLWTLLGFGTLEVVVEFHAPTTLAECGSRKTLARYCEEKVAAGMANALSGRVELPPGAPRRPPGRAPASTNAPAAAMG